VRPIECFSFVSVAIEYSGFGEFSAVRIEMSELTDNVRIERKMSELTRKMSELTENRQKKCPN